MADIDHAEPGELVANALIYARIGWKVFPLWWVEDDGRCACPLGRRGDADACTSPGKHPLHHLTPRGVKQATADEDTISGWWELFPSANIGLPAGDNGLAVLDVDPDHGGDESLGLLLEVMEKAGSPFPGTLSATTGSGGKHFFFTAPDGGIKSAAKVLGPDMPGVDTRGRGGYVVAAPSNHASGRLYRWDNFLADEAPWPALLAKLVDPPRPTPEPRPATHTRPAGDGSAASRWATAALAAEVEKLQAEHEGGRNHALNRAAFSLGQIIAGGYLAASEVGRELLSVALSIGLGEAESRKTILSGFRSGASKPRHPQAAHA